MEIMVRILIKNWIHGGTIYILAGNAGTTQCTLHHTYTNIPGHDEDLDAGRIIRFTKEAKWHSFHRSNNIILCFYMVINFQLGNNN
jgi:fatty acid desaturase